MLKVLVSLTVLFAFAVCFSQANVHGHDEFIGKLRDYINEEIEEETVCTKTADCPDGFFCKYGSCLAKKREHSLCLSGSDEECMCGKCATNPRTWSRMCMTDDDSTCQDDGETQVNTCKTNNDCPAKYFCDHLSENVCTSKLPAGRVCHNNAMCACGKCIEKKYFSRQHLEPIVFNVCDTCNN